MLVAENPAVPAPAPAPVPMVPENPTRSWHKLSVVARQLQDYLIGIASTRSDRHVTDFSPKMEILVVKKRCCFLVKKI